MLTVATTFYFCSQILSYSSKGLKGYKNFFTINMSFKSFDNELVSLGKFTDL